VVKAILLACVDRVSRGADWRRNNWWRLPRARPSRQPEPVRFPGG